MGNVRSAVRNIKQVPCPFKFHSTIFITSLPLSIYLYYYVIVETLTVNSAKTRSKPFKNDIKKHVSSDYILYFITQLLQMFLNHRV